MALPGGRTNELRFREPDFWFFGFSHVRIARIQIVLACVESLNRRGTLDESLHGLKRNYLIPCRRRQGIEKGNPQINVQTRQ